jgi:hypothetical protein
LDQRRRPRGLGVDRPLTQLNARPKLMGMVEIMFVLAKKMNVSGDGVTDHPMCSADRFDGSREPRSEHRKSDIPGLDAAPNRPGCPRNPAHG